ncbi:MAG: hypothetical protein HY205_00825 [Nitrospirae bacterium]|nr:hypothetical protein [Nitrospirota bacterium]
MFSQEDLQKIREAVQAAEPRTRGEIVPMVVPSSARYRDASHRAGLALALLVLTVVLTADYGWTSWAGWAGWGWSRHEAGWIVMAVGLAYVLGQWLGSFPACIRLMVSRARMAAKVRLRAERAFYEHGLHRTREGTGVLIMVSLLERQVQVLADRAIDARVAPGTWDRLVQDLIKGITDGRPTEALCRAIARCGDLLARHFPARDGDNPDELADELIQEK